MLSTPFKQPMTIEQRLQRLENENRINRAMLGRDISRRTNHENEIIQEIWANNVKMRLLRQEIQNESESSAGNVA